MRSALLARVMVPFLFLAGVSVAAGACSSSSDTASPDDSDAGQGSDATSMPRDAQQDTSLIEDGGVDADPPATVADEVEPNNGATATELGTMVLPGTMNGKIDPANDIDIFSIKLAPGDFWEWTATPKSADLAPHVVVFDSAGGLNPTVIGFEGGCTGDPPALRAPNRDLRGRRS
jgi:hypothetical protein